MSADLLNHPFDPNTIIRKKRSIKKALLTSDITWRPCRIAFLGGSTTAEIRDILELFLLNNGLQPQFYESQYNRFFEEAAFDNPELDSFNPQYVIIHSGIVNIDNFPCAKDDVTIINEKFRKIIESFKVIWDRLSNKYHCDIIQNNFELPHYRIFGNLDAVDHRGMGNFVLKLNSEFALSAQKMTSLHINDVHYLSAMTGLQEWFDHSFWCMYKYALSYKAIPLFCNNIANIIGAAQGKSKKLLVLDLDNTLWGGVIGDDGVSGIRIGKDDPLGEAFTMFQEYVKSLKERGVMLAICSKNEMASVREGLSHPDMVLKEDDFIAIHSTWGPKDKSIREIASELNIGMDSIVFVDDNAVERELVKGNLPDVAVPDVGSDVTRFAAIIDQAGYFDTVSLSGDDLARNEYYVQNSKRTNSKTKFATHDEYLHSLEMIAEIGNWSQFYLERIVQLINKTNQFNLTVKRLSQAEATNLLESTTAICLYGKLSDKFGNNGLVSVLMGRIDDNKAVHIDLWVMSCRVFNRDLELTMFDELASRCIQQQITAIYGYYMPSAKNGFVAELYKRIGFEKVSETADGATVWVFQIQKDYTQKNTVIAVRGVLYGNCRNACNDSGCRKRCV